MMLVSQQHRMVVCAAAIAALVLSSSGAFSQPPGGEFCQCQGLTCMPGMCNKQCQTVGCICGGRGCTCVGLRCSNFPAPCNTGPFCPNCGVMEGAEGCPKWDPNSICSQPVCANGTGTGCSITPGDCECGGWDCDDICTTGWCNQGAGQPDPYTPCDGPDDCGDGIGTGCGRDPCACEDMCPAGLFGSEFDCYAQAGCCMGAECPCTACPLSAGCTSHQCSDAGCDAPANDCTCAEECSLGGDWDCGGAPGACEQGGGGGEGMLLMLSCHDLCGGQCGESCCPMGSECAAVDCW